MKKSSTLHRLLSYTKPYKIYLLGAILSAIISISLTLYCPILVGNVIDLIVGAGNVHYTKILKILIILGINNTYKFIFSMDTFNFNNYYNSKNS